MADQNTIKKLEQIVSSPDPKLNEQFAAVLADAIEEIDRDEIDGLSFGIDYEGDDEYDIWVEFRENYNGVVYLPRDPGGVEEALKIYDMRFDEIDKSLFNVIDIDPEWMIDNFIDPELRWVEDTEYFLPGTFFGDWTVKLHINKETGEGVAYRYKNPKRIGQVIELCAEDADHLYDLMDDPSKDPIDRLEDCYNFINKYEDWGGYVPNEDKVERLRPQPKEDHCFDDDEDDFVDTLGKMCQPQC